MTPESINDTTKIDVLFLGAGFSRAVTDNESPLMSDFFSRLDRRKHWQLWRFLEEVFGNPVDANIEKALLFLDQLSASPLHGVDPFFDQCRVRHREVRKELDEYIIERLAHLKIGPTNWAAHVLACATEKTTVITTNYDTTADRILSSRRGLHHHVPNTNCHHCKLCRILNDECASGPLDGLTDMSWRGSLLKLHGSIAWSRCTADTCCNCDCLLPDMHCRPFNDKPCPSCGGNCSPVLVPPSMVKSFDDFPGLKRIWNAAYMALSEAKSILFFGFSFPTSDALINEVMRAAFAKNRRAIDFSIVDVNPEKPASLLADMVGEACDGTISLYRVPTDGTEPDWLTTAKPVDAA